MGYWRNATTYEEGGGAQRTVTVGLKPRAYDRPTAGGGSVLTAMTHRLGDSGDAQLPHGLSELLNVRLADKLAGQSPIVHVGRGTHYIRMSALGTQNNVNGAVVLDGTGFPIGRRWNGAWLGADLEYLCGGHYLRKQVYLHAGHPTSFEFRIDGLAGVLSPSARGWDLQDDAGRPVLWAGAGYLYDPNNPLAAMVPVPTTVRIQGGKQIYRYELPAGSWAGWVLEPTWTSQPGAADGLDTIINPNQPNTNNATNPSVAMGNSGLDTWRELIKFSLDALPGGAIISSTTLSLFATTDFSNNARTVRIFRQRRAWVETQATWNIYSTGNNWQTAGGFGTNDCEQTDIGNRNMTASETLNQFKDFVLTPTSKAALDLGNGWLIKADTESGDGYLYASSNNITAAWHPTLTVVYTLPSGGIGRGRAGVLGRL